MTNGGPMVSDIVAQFTCSICLDRLRIATTSVFTFHGIFMVSYNLTIK